MINLSATKRVVKWNRLPLQDGELQSHTIPKFSRASLNTPLLNESVLFKAGGIATERNILLYIVIIKLINGGQIYTPLVIAQQVKSGQDVNQHVHQDKLC